MTAFRWALVIFGALLVLALLSGRVPADWSAFAVIGAAVGWAVRHLFGPRPPPVAPAVTPARAELDVQLRTADDAASAKYAADIRAIDERLARDTATDAALDADLARRLGHRP